MRIIESTKVFDYTAIMTANGGEDQMTIISTPVGMDDVKLVIVTVDCTGNLNTEHENVTLTNFGTFVRQRMLEWCLFKSDDSRESRKCFAGINNAIRTMGHAEYFGG